MSTSAGRGLAGDSPWRCDALAPLRAGSHTARLSLAPARSPIEADDIAALRVSLVGYGEVAGIFGAALAKAGVDAVTAFDVQIADASWAATARARASNDGVALVSKTSDAVANAALVISAVTAGATASAAEQIASACRRGTFVLDLNSASPDTKIACAEAVETAGGRYVEAAVMSPVSPHGIRVPMLLGGPQATTLQPTLAKLGFAATVGPTSYGDVSAIKLCRSVIVKGMEALAIESLLTARRYGVSVKCLRRSRRRFRDSNGSDRRPGPGAAS